MTDSPHTGIFVHEIPAVTTQSVWGNGGEEFRVQLCSDLHIGGSAVDLKRFYKEMERAGRVGARVNLNGDVFDAIWTKDPRFQQSVLHKELQGRDDLVDGAIEMAFNILKPYAGLFDVIGDGNHERTVLKHHNLNLVKNCLIPKLNSVGGNIRYGGYCGFIRYKLPQDRLVTIYYHHGAGGTAPVTKGMIEHQRVSCSIEGCDVIWLGHNHWKYNASSVKISPDGGFREEHQIRTGAYRLHTENDYAIIAGMPPQPHGGALLFVELDGDHKRLECLQ